MFNTASGEVMFGNEITISIRKTYTKGDRTLITYLSKSKIAHTSKETSVEGFSLIRGTSVRKRKRIKVQAPPYRK
jgi:hypothetical protein